MSKHFLCDAASLPEGEARKIDIDGRQIALFHAQGAFFALDDRCTHGNASLSDGYIEDDCSVECPLHAARFSLKTGAVLCGPATEDAPAYAVSVDDGKVYIELAEAFT